MVLGALAPNFLQAQDVVRISTDAAACEVVIEEVVRLGGLEDPASMTAGALVTQVESGDFVVADPEIGAELMVYGRDGRYRRSVGRYGEGPGEFEWPGGGALLPSPEGGLMILDPASRRITTLSADWEFVRSTDVGAMFALSFLPLRSGEGFVVAGWGDAAAEPLAAITKVIDVDGRLLEELPAVETDAGMRNMFFFPFAQDREGRVWRALPTAYAIEALDLSAAGGEARLEGEPEWFTPGPPSEGYPMEAPSPSAIHGLRFVRGLAWIVTGVADERWREAVANLPEEVPPDAQLLFDGVIEVVEPSTGTLVARGVHDDLLRWTGDGSFLYAVRDGGLIPQALIFEPSLVGPDCPRAGDSGAAVARRGRGAHVQRIVARNAVGEARRPVGFGTSQHPREAS